MDDLRIATENITGDLLDLEAAGLLDARLDPLDMAAEVERAYLTLWCELTGEEVLDADERHRIDSRIRRINELGYDVAEMNVCTVGEQLVVRTEALQPDVYSRRLHELTGLTVQERQARRLMGDLSAFRKAKYPHGGAPSELVAAHRWLVEAFVPTVDAVPRHLRGKLEPAQLFHEVLEHQWYLSEQAGHDIGLDVAAASYVNDVLVHKPDEQAVLGELAAAG